MKQFLASSREVDLPMTERDDIALQAAQGAYIFGGRNGFDACKVQKTQRPPKIKETPPATSPPLGSPVASDSALPD